MSYASLHIILLSGAFLGLCLGIKKDNWILRTLALLLLSGDIAMSFYSGYGVSVFQVGASCIILSALLLAIPSIKAKKDWSLFLAFGLIILGASNVMMNSLLSKLTITETEDELSLLVEFTNQGNLREWIKQNDTRYKIDYPAFEAEDHSFQMDEYLCITLASKNYDHILSQLESDHNIVHIEKNDTYQLKIPNSNEARTYKQRQTINDPEVNKQWAAKNFKLKEFHDRISEKNKLKNKKQKTIIAILDTGIDSQHEDLKDNYHSISSAYDKDTKGHGTHCAGVAAAVTGNKIGIASWIPPNHNIKVSSVKVLNNMGIGTQRTIINGILKAADAGADVISLSLGGRTSESKEKAYNEAVKYANDKGAIVVVAAGNSSADASRYSPANTQGAITVAAIDTMGRPANFSNHVRHVTYGISAPGTSIYSTIPNDKYTAYNGTSMAAPFISGLIGVLKHYQPTLTTEQAYQLIIDTADKNAGVNTVNPNRLLEAFFEEKWVQ